MGCLVWLANWQAILRTRKGRFAKLQGFPLPAVLHAIELGLAGFGVQFCRQEYIFAKLQGFPLPADLHAIELGLAGFGVQFCRQFCRRKGRSAKLHGFSLLFGRQFCRGKGRSAKLHGFSLLADLPAKEIGLVGQIGRQFCKQKGRSAKWLVGLVGKFARRKVSLQICGIPPSLQICLH